MFLKHLSEQCDAHNLNAELVIVEWNPNMNSSSLYEATSWPKGENLDIRIITVPGKIHNMFENSDIFHMFQMIAKNVGIRRAKAQWVLCTNVDILFSDALTTTLANSELDPDVYYRVDRYDLGVRIIPESLSMAARLAFCEDQVIRVQNQTGTMSPAAHDARKDPDENTPHTNACGDFTLLSRDKWIELRGYPEFPISSIYIDGLLLYAAKATGMRQKILPPPCKIYHIEHGEGWVLDKKSVMAMPRLDYNSGYRALTRQMLDSHSPLDVNATGWGLADVQLAEQRIPPLREM